MSRRREVEPGGPSWIDGFSWWDDVFTSMYTDIGTSTVAGIGELVTSLKAARVLMPAMGEPGAPLALSRDSSYKATREAWMRSELDSPEFLRVCQTPENWENAPLNIGFMELQTLSTGRASRVAWINPPEAWRVSESLTELAFAAHQLGASPAFHQDRHIAALDSRLRSIATLASGESRTSDGAINDTDSSRVLLGQSVFSLTAEMFSDSIVDRLGVSDILALRSKYVVARRCLLDDCLVKVQDAVAEEESLQACRARVKMLCQSELAPALRAFRADVQHERDKLIGNLAIRVTEAGALAMAGAPAGGLIGSVILGHSLWSAVVLGAAVAATRTMPRVATDVQGYWMEIRKAKRTSFAYLDTVLSRR